MALGSQNRQKRKTVPPKLMLTSMMDMFTIILIFLLFSFSEEPETIKLGKDLELPHSTAESGYQKTLKLVLTKTELRLNDEVMSEIKNKKIVGLAPEDLKASSLFQRLKTYREKSKNENSESIQQHVLFLCDENYSFKTINDVIKTAGLAGYPNFQFAVLEKKE